MQGDHAEDHHQHHAEMVANFGRRFWISLVFTVPVLALSPLIQQALDLDGAVRFPSQGLVHFGFASFIFFHGGWPFLTGLFREVSDKRPGMMTLIALAMGPWDW